MSTVIKGKIKERSAQTLLARVKNPNTKHYITQATISSISYEVWDISTPTKITAATSLTVANVVFNTLQTASGWSVDATGFNFAFTLAGTNFPDAKTYQVDVQFTPSSGSTFIVSFLLTAQKVYYGDV